MDNKLKTYHFKKLNYYIKRTNLIFFCFINNLNNEDQLTLNQKLFKSNIEIYKIKKTLTQKIIKNSIFSNSSILIKGPLSIVVPKNIKEENLNIQNLLNFDSNMLNLAIKLNKKLYSNLQLKKISTLNYNNNIKILNKTFKRLIKKPYIVLKKYN